MADDQLTTTYLYGCGGYDIQPLSEIPQDFYCMICLKIMRDPVQFVCGHGSCKGCFKDLILSSNQRSTAECPQCRKTISESQTVPAYMINRMILSLKIKCINTQCRWTGELSDNENHTSKCEFKKIKCSNEQCTELVERCRMEEHLKNCSVKMDGNKTALLQEIMKKLEDQQTQLSELTAKALAQQDEIDALKYERVVGYGDSVQQQNYQQQQQQQQQSPSSPDMLLNQLTERVTNLESIDPLSTGYVWSVPNFLEFLEIVGGASVSSCMFKTSLRGYLCQLLLLHSASKPQALHLEFRVFKEGSSEQRHFNYKVVVTACGREDSVLTQFDATTFSDGTGDVLWRRDVLNFLSGSKFKKIKAGGYLKLVCNFLVNV